MLSDFRPEVQKEILHHFVNVGKFDHARLLEIEPGHAKACIDIEEEALNVYGNVHGGFLFSLADAVAGMATYAYEITSVTQCSSFNFLRGVNSGTIYVEANTIHKGRKTAVMEVTITNDQGKPIACGTFTLFLGQPV